jgi:serine/threonine-protein kinase
MDTCPSAEVLKQLLANKLPGPVVQTVYDHVGACAACQSVLEELSEDTALRQWRRADAGLPALSGADTGPCLGQLLERARTPVGWTTGPEERPPASSPQAPAFLAPPRREGDLGALGPYPIEAELGRGGMGIVLRGYDEGLQRTVALKVLKPELAEERARARFVREARAAARVRHDHVVSVHAVASPPDGPPYLVMEHLAGPTLAGLIRARQRLEPRQAAVLAAQVADGLAAAHAAGLIHRDIKPANVILDAVTGRAKITDFGLARSVAQPSDLTQEGALAGTPAYMSPEQARGSDTLDPRTDVYSLGVTLYEALTGEVPFRGAPHMVLRQVLSDEPRMPRRLNDAVPRDLETVCLKAMAKEPHRRYASAADLRDDLRRWLEGKPIRARPVGRVERLLRWCRREPVRAGLLAALLLALAGALWQWWRAEQNADDARRQHADALAALQEADEHFARAAKAADSFYGRVYAEGLVGRPVSPELRKSLMEDALDFYRSLPPSRRADPAMRAGEAETNFRIGFALSQMQRPREALDAFERARPSYEALLEASPEDARLARGLAHCHFHAGRMYDALGDAGGARRSWAEARDRLASLAARDPNDVESRFYLAGCYGNLSAVYLWNDEPEEARRACQSARPLLEELIAKPGDDFQRLRHQIDLTYVYRTLGDLAPDTEEAVRWQERGRDLAGAVEATHGNDSSVVRAVAMSREHLGLAKARQGRGTEALELLQKAHGSLLTVPRLDERQAALFDGCLAECCLHLGDVQRDLRRPEDALRSWEEARAISEKLPVVTLRQKEFRENLARAHLRIGDLQRERGNGDAAAQSWRKARDVWDGLLKEYPEHPRLRRERAALAARLGDAPSQ